MSTTTTTIESPARTTTPTLTAEGVRLLSERARQLRDEVLPSMRPLLVEWDRDERIVADFERIQSDLDRLEQLLAAARVLPAEREPDGTVRLGDRVELLMPDGEHESVMIVDPEEAVLDDERVSATSPLARSVLGAKVGDVVEVSAPSGAWPCRVLRVNGLPKRLPKQR